MIIMKKYEVLKKLTDIGVVAVIRASSKEEAEKIVSAVGKGGIKAIEITMTVPGAIEIIAELVKTADKDMIIGAGTVLDSETARACMLAGAKYIVSPCFDEATARCCNRYAIPYMAGIMTPKEAVCAMEFGVDILKVFPGGAFGPSIIKDLKGPLPQGNYMPTGGVSLDNVKDWIKMGAIAVGTGGSLTAGAKTGDFEKVTNTARAFVEAVKEARENR